MNRHNEPGEWYEVQHWTIADGWRNVWRNEADEPDIYSSRDEAAESLADFFDDVQSAVELGHMSADSISRDDYRIVRVQVQP